VLFMNLATRRAKYDGGTSSDQIRSRIMGIGGIVTSRPPFLAPPCLPDALTAFSRPLASSTDGAKE
jgi:hypothetical protein